MGESISNANAPVHPSAGMLCTVDASDGSSDDRRTGKKAAQRTESYSEVASDVSTEATDDECTDVLSDVGSPVLGSSDKFENDDEVFGHQQPSERELVTGDVLHLDANCGPHNGKSADEIAADAAANAAATLLQRLRQRSGDAFRTSLLSTPPRKKEAALPLQEDEDEEDALSMCNAGRRVRFNLAGVTVHKIRRYAEIYGVHPRYFDFDSSYRMVPSEGFGSGLQGPPAALNDAADPDEADAYSDSDSDLEDGCEWVLEVSR